MLKSSIKNKPNLSNLYFHGCTNNHCFLQNIFIELWWMIIKVQNCDKNFCKAVFPLCVLCLDKEIVLGFHLSIQTSPGLGVDDS